MKAFEQRVAWSAFIQGDHSGEKVNSRGEGTGLAAKGPASSLGER